MTPEQTPTGGLNIDQMLQTLSSQPTGVMIDTPNLLPEVNLIPPVSQQEQVLQPSFSIENLAKPVTVSAPYISEQQTLRTALVPKWLKMVWSVVATFIVVIVGAWVVSIQYPVETKTYTDKIFGVIGSVVATTENNLQPNTILVDNVIGSWTEQVHSVAPDNYIVDTPLADAMAQSQDLLTQDTTTENLLDTVVGDTTTSPSIDTGSEVIETGSEVVPVSSSPDFDLPSVTQSLSNSELQTKLLTLSQSSQEAMTNLIGNSDVKMAKMRAVYKSSQALLVQISDDSFLPDAAFIDQIAQLQLLYDSTIVK